MQRLLLPAGVALAFFGGLEWMMGGTFMFFVDMPSLIIVLLCPLVYLTAVFGFSDFREAFAAVKAEGADENALRFSLGFFKTYGAATWLFAVVACGMSVIQVLSDLTNTARMGPLLAITFLCVLYAAMVHLLLICPFTARVSSRLADMRQTGKASGIDTRTLTAE